MGSAQPAPHPRETASAANSAPAAESSWPHDVSHAPTMSIGAALAVLIREFPAVRISKVRFLEEQGIVTPQRTASGYRSYSQADIERLRFALAAQRDSFLPLKVIRERLDELDRSGVGAPSIGARVVTEDGGLTSAATSASMTIEQLADACQIDEQRIESFLELGLLRRDYAGRFSPSSREIVETLVELDAEGVEPRHLKSLQTGAERQVELIRQLTEPIRSRKKSSSAAAAAVRSRELSHALSNLYAHLVDDGVERL